jgi:hypothetical protein
VISSSGDLVAVAWLERTDTVDGPTASVYCRSSKDGGRAFEPSRVVAELRSYPGNLVLAASSSSIHIAWLATQFGSGLPVSVDYSVSRDGGATFEPPRSVSGSEHPWLPDLRVDGDRVAVSWCGLGTVWSALSADAGATFDPPEGLSGGWPCIDGSLKSDLDGNVLFLAWLANGPTGRAVVSRRLVLDAIDPNEPIHSFASAKPVSFELALDATGSSVTLVWVEGTSLVAVESGNRGTSFGAPVVVGTVSAIAFPRLAVDADGVSNIAFLDDDTRLRFLKLGGATGHDGRVLASGAVSPDLALGGNLVCVTWLSGGGSGGVLRAALSSSQGSTFEKRIRLNGRGSRGTGCRVTVGRDVAHLVWQEPRKGALDIFYRRLEPRAPRRFLTGPPS